MTPIIASTFDLGNMVENAALIVVTFVVAAAVGWLFSAVITPKQAWTKIFG